MSDTQKHKMPNVPKAEIIDITPDSGQAAMWKDRMINLENHYPEPEFMLDFDNKKCFTRGDVVVIKGKPKKGKSHLMVVFIVALIKGEFIGIERIESTPKKILYIDAEMHPNYSAVLARKIHFAAGQNIRQNIEQLTVLNLKGDAPIERERIIEDAMKELKPDIVFIDGVKDITRTEHNDPVEGKRLGEELKQWTTKYNCLIAVAIHENKNDMNSRGAAGAAVEEIASETWRIDKDIDGVFTASQTASRYHSPIENLSFSMDDRGNILKGEAKPKVSSEEKKLEKIKFLFSQVFTNHRQLTFTGLQDEYMRVARVKQTAAYNAITFAIDNKIIVKNFAGEYELSNLTLPHN